MPLHINLLLAGSWALWLLEFCADSKIFLHVTFEVQEICCFPSVTPWSLFVLLEMLLLMSHDASLQKWLQWKIGEFLFVIVILYSLSAVRW